MNLWSEKEVLIKNCSFGFAMDCMIQGRRITRAGWGGYWKMGNIVSITGNVIIAYLKDGTTKSIASPYQEDMLACDWIVLANEKELINKNEYVDKYGEKFNSFKYIKLNEDGANLMNQFMDKFIYKAIKPLQTKCEIDNEYQQLIYFFENQKLDTRELELLKLIAGAIVCDFVRQIWS